MADNFIAEARRHVTEAEKGIAEAERRITELEALAASFRLDPDEAGILISEIRSR